MITKYYKNKNYTPFFVKEKQNPEERAAIHTEGAAVKKEENTTTKQFFTRKIHNNDLHAKIVHHEEYMMRTTVKHLQYRVKEVLEVCEYCAMVKINQKFIHKVAEERDHKPGDNIFLDIS